MLLQHNPIEPSDPLPFPAPEPSSEPQSDEAETLPTEPLTDDKRGEPDPPKGASRLQYVPPNTPRTS